MTFTTGLHVLGWTVVVCVLLVAVMTDYGRRPSWCPFEKDPKDCVSEAVLR